MAVLPVLTTAGKVLLGLGRQLPTIATTAGVGLGGTAAVGRTAQALGLPFATNDEVAEGLSYDLDKNKVERTGKLGNILRDFVTGTDTNEINRIAEENAITQANTNTEGARKDLLQRSEALGGGLTLEGLERRDGETANEMLQRYERDGKKLDVLEYQQLHGLDVAPGQSMAAAMQAKTQKDKENPLSPENRYINQLKKDAADRKYQSELLAYNERKSDARYAFESEQAALNRQENLKMRMFDREDARADRAAADRRADRKERQMMIMQLLKGLGTLGGALAI